MAKKSAIGLSTAPRDKPKKRPGRHSKRPNKKYTKKKYRGQGRWLKNLYAQMEECR